MSEVEINKIEEIENPVKLFDEKKVMDRVIEKIGDLAKSNTNNLDVSIAKNRKVIASAANKVARSKTFIDGLGKGLVADFKKQVNAIDAQRRYMRNKLDALKEEVRKPLTKWEKDERDRITNIQSRIDALLVPFDGSVIEIEARIASIKNIDTDKEFSEFADKAKLSKNAALQMGREALEQEQANIAAERKRKEAEEAKRLVREQNIRNEAIAGVREEIASKLQDARKARDNAEIRAKEVEKAVNKQTLVEEVKDAQTTVQKEVANIENVISREQQADVNRSIMNALITKAGLNEQQAKVVVIKIIRGEIPHLNIEY